MDFAARLAAKEETAGVRPLGLWPPPGEEGFEAASPFTSTSHVVFQMRRRVGSSFTLDFSTSLLESVLIQEDNIWRRVSLVF